MNSLTKVLLEDLLEAENKKITAIYGGGFKPPTKGHYAVVEKAAEQDPEIDDIIIYVGGGERDGITQAESIQVWELYKKYLPLKVRIEPSKAPVGDVLRYAKEHPDEEVLWIIGARENNPEDFADIASRTRTIDKYPNLQLRVIQTSGGVSGTAARKAVRDNNKEQFFHLIPDIEEKEQVWDIVSPVIKEGFVDDLKSKFNKFISAAKQEGKETKEALSLLIKSAKGDIDLTDDQKKEIGNQLKDVLKLVGLTAIATLPGGFIAAALIKLFKAEYLITPSSMMNEYNNTGPSTPKVYIVKADGNYKEVPIEILSKIPNLTYDMGGGETNFFPEKNIVIVDNIPINQFAQEPGEIKDEKIYVEYNLNQPFSFPKANKIIASQIVYHLGDIKSFAKTINDSLKNGGTFQFFSDLMNKQDKEFLNYLSSEYRFGLPKNLNPYKGGNLLLKKGDYTEPVISYIYSVTDAEGNTAKISVTKEGRWWEYAKIEGDIDFKPSKWSVEPEYKYNNIIPSKENVLDSFSQALKTDIVDFKKLNETLDEGSCGYDTDVATGKKLDTPGGLKEADSINEGRYDSISRQLAKLTLNYWKEGFAKGKNEINYIDRITPDEYPTDLEFLYNGEVIFTSAGDKYSHNGYAMSRGESKDGTPRVGVNYFVPKDMIPQGWEEIYMDLITTLRHEIEHLTQSGGNVKQGKEMGSDMKLRKLIGTNKDVVRYVLLPKEVDANVQGLYLKAKKWRRPYVEVVDEWIKDFLKIKKQSDIDLIKGIYDKRAKELNLPAIQENDPFGIKAYARELVNEALKDTWNPKESFVSLSKFMIDNGMNITPLPKIKVIKDDKENASNLLGKTAYYDPNNKSITLFTMDRHPKDILRSFSHEMVHHEQNLNGKLNNINTTNTNEDGDLPEIEREAYEKGNIMLRNWEDTIKNV
jgi:hypothetical protein